MPVGPLQKITGTMFYQTGKKENCDCYIQLTNHFETCWLDYGLLDAATQHQRLGQHIRDHTFKDLLNAADTQAKVVAHKTLNRIT